MCGVCGVVRWERGGDDAAAREREVAAMLDALVHRGPDDRGQRTSGAATVGATRLAIRGLASGQQPMVDAASGVVAVCNGEIDNHAELREWLRGRGRAPAQDTDIAVIPGLYAELGEAFVERLVGAFAIAVWDPRSARLLLARDRAGERPLFFAAVAGQVRFATEIAALAAVPAQPLTADPAALRAFLRFGYFASPASPFVEARKVGPAELVVVGPSGAVRRRYWRWNIADAPKTAPRRGQFDAVFREAVRRQSEVDVRYGAFLSGGIDSSLVAAVARSERPAYPLKAFTIRFSERSYDEGLFAQHMAERLGIPCDAVWVVPDAFPPVLADLIAHAGEPLADPAWVPTALLSRRAAEEVKVALVGEGGDELFGGYPTYIGALISERYGRLPPVVKRICRRLVEAWPPSDKKVSISFLLKKFVASADLDGMRRHADWTSNIGSGLLARLGVEEPEAVDEAWDATRLLDAVQRHDLETSLAEGLLTKADRASMNSALELRAPFLDRDVIEYAATLPPSSRVSGVTTKVFLKRYASAYLPRGIVHRRKRGLSVPLSSWLRGPLFEWASGRIGSPRLGLVGVGREGALALLDEHRSRKADHARALWTLIVLSEWLDWAAGRPMASRA
ncbi:MAG TPA: asparagine synthase (glutamine-hydrolyzing) [Gemmatimonadales bacterium]|nr:asparagine synthase (glutamine-hydrolyzing) [Gemmatimonadales bacterium]